MNQSSDSNEELQPAPNPGEGWVVAWDGPKKVAIHKILNHLNPPRAVIESGGCVFGLEVAAEVYPDERNACVAGWMKRMEEAATAMKRAEEFKKRADQLNKTSVT